MILIGVYKRRSENASQLWSKEDRRQIFSEIISRERYQQSLRVLCFDDVNGKKTSQRQIIAN